MKIIQVDSEDGKRTRPDGKGQPLRKRRLGGLGEKERRSEEMLVNTFQKYLDDRYHLMRHVQLEGLNIEAPMVLVGPPGILVIISLSLRGVCRIKEDKLECMDARLHHYSAVKPDYVERLMQICSAIDSQLLANGYDRLAVEPVLIFTDAGLHIELVNPSIRVVVVDALDRFIHSLLNSAQRINWAEGQALIRIISGQVEESQTNPEELIEDDFSFREQTKKQFKVPELTIPMPEDQRVVSAMKKVPFTTQQLFFLGMLIFINIVILTAFVVIILILS